MLFSLAETSLDAVQRGTVAAPATPVVAKLGLRLAVENRKIVSITAREGVTARFVIFLPYLCCLSNTVSDQYIHWCVKHRITPYTNPETSSKVDFRFLLASKDDQL